MIIITNVIGTLIHFCFSFSFYQTISSCYTFYMNKTRLTIRTKRGILFAVLFGVITAVILVFSGFNGEISSSQSGFVVNVLTSILRFFGIVLNDAQLETFAYLVRKLIGHFLIFVLDGLFAYFAYHNLLEIKSKWLMIIISVATGFFVAGLSELIQFFTSGRSGNLIDVGIDLFGALVGVALAIFIAWPIKEKTEKRSASS